MMQKLYPNLWFDKEAREAAEFYVSVLPDSKIVSVNTLHNTPSGDTDIVTFSLCGQKFMAISAGPIFKLNPSISFTITASTPEEATDLYQKLSAGGADLMPFQEYPWSKRYGWFVDKYGLSWQINTEEKGGRIIPTLMFTQDKFGKCEEAMNFYASVFKNSSIGSIFRYEEGEGDEAGKVKHAEFKLEGETFRAQESSLDHKFVFNEAVSICVTCKDQAEIDYYWEKLSAVPESEQCGWLKDKYGVSWQITPEILDTLMSGDRAKADRVTQAFLEMHKIDIAALERAANG